MRLSDVVGSENLSAVANPAPSASSFTLSEAAVSPKRTASTSAEENDRPVVQRELFAVHERSRDEDHPSSHFIDVSRGVGVIATDEFAKTEQPIELENPNALAIKGLGQFKQYPAVAELSEAS